MKPVDAPWLECTDERIVILASHRQPLSHMRTPQGVTTTSAAGGVTRALTPLACRWGAHWVAQSTGDADHEFGPHLHLQGSTGPGATLHRLRIPAPLSSAHGDGFSNSTLWPLLHDPARFDASGCVFWKAYAEVNRMFAQHIVKAASYARDRATPPVVLINDYQLALVPAMLRARLPGATIVLFWHVPWIHHPTLIKQPWLAAMLQGMCEADLIGFQTPEFSEAFAQTLAQRSPQLRAPVIRDYSISVEWPARDACASTPVGQASLARVDLCTRWEIDPAQRLVVSIDRFDYSKGFLERLDGIEQLFAEFPQWLGKVTFLQVAAPSRVGVEGYRSYHEQVRHRVGALNERFKNARWQPIKWIEQVQTAAQVEHLHRHADVFLVTSLIDGMNLVCKEFVIACTDLNGVLVLSKGAGAARELMEAVQFDPLEPSDMARSLHTALDMPEGEVRKRMQALRNRVRTADLHQWGDRLLSDAMELRRALDLV